MVIRFSCLCRKFPDGQHAVLFDISTINDSILNGSWESATDVWFSSYISCKIVEYIPKFINSAETEEFMKNLLMVLPLFDITPLPLRNISTKLILYTNFFTGYNFHIFTWSNLPYLNLNPVREMNKIFAKRDLGM